MASEEIVLVVGSDISLVDLEADIEVGESPRGGNSVHRKQYDVSDDSTALPVSDSENSHDENVLSSQACSGPIGTHCNEESPQVPQNSHDTQLLESDEDYSDDQISRSRFSMTNLYLSSDSFDEDYDEGLQKVVPGQELPPPCVLDNGNAMLRKSHTSMTGKRTSITINCDKQTLVTMVDTDQDCCDDHILCKEMNEFTHINGLHHVTREAWKDSPSTHKHLPFDSNGTSKATNELKISKSNENGLPDSRTKEVTESSSDTSNTFDSSEKGTDVGTPDSESFPGSSSRFQGLHRTVIDLQPAHIVHRSSTTLPECSQAGSLIESLPEEILLNIFSYLSPKELCHNVAPICHRWHDLAYEPTLWRCLKVDPMWEVTFNDICKLLERVSGVRALSLRNRNLMTYSEVAQYLRFCRQLSELDLGLCDNVNIYVILCILEYCPLLKSLNVEGCCSVDFECVKHIATLNHLSHLNLSHCRLENDSVDVLVSKLHSIVSFNVDGVSWITDEAIIPLCETHRTTLRHLELDGEELSDRSILAVSACLGLQTLTVSFCDLLTDTSLDYLKDLRQLRKLRLRKGLEFSEEAVVKFFEHGHLKNVVDLDMSECAGMKDCSILALTQNFGHELESLALRWCWSITDVGLISIVDHCSNLKILDLTGLHRLSGECLDRVPDDMTRLTFLDLRNCNNINDKLIYEMIRCKPDLQVINYYGELFIYGETNS